MKETFRNHYFVVCKLICLIIFLTYRMYNGSEELRIKAYTGLYFAVFLIAAVFLEFTEKKKQQYALLTFEGILSLIGVFLFPVTGTVCMVVSWLDLCAVFDFPAAGYLPAYAVVFLMNAFSINAGIAFGFITLAVFSYIQEKSIVRKYREEIRTEENIQSELIGDMELQTKNHEEAMKRSRLKYENEILEERNRISQALHDKLGHNINGSLYQLEAARLLIDKKPEDSKDILQAVIGQLRTSMDEIRAILRKEKPDKKRMALISLQNLCEECESSYRIKAHLNISDDDAKITEEIWDILLDNTCEAVTNALKYAKCRNIFIDIIAMNEIVRCSIRDDGKGCEHIEDGMGLTGMRNRVRKVKGYIDIEAEAGFSINMVLPLEGSR